MAADPATAHAEGYRRKRLCFRPPVCAPASAEHSRSPVRATSGGGSWSPLRLTRPAAGPSFSTMRATRRQATCRAASPTGNLPMRWRASTRHQTPRRTTGCERMVRRLGKVGPASHSDGHGGYPSLRAGGELSAYAGRTLPLSCERTRRGNGRDSRRVKRCLPHAGDRKPAGGGLAPIPVGGRGPDARCVSAAPTPPRLPAGPPAAWPVPPPPQAPQALLRLPADRPRHQQWRRLWAIPGAPANRRLR